MFIMDVCKMLLSMVTLLLQSGVHNLFVIVA